MFTNNEKLSSSNKTSNSTPNPFVVQKLFAQWMITNDHQPGGYVQIGTNTIYVVVYAALWFYSMQTENAFISSRYSFISAMRFYVQFVICPVLFLQIAFTTTVFRGKYVNALKMLIENDAQLRLIGIETHYALRSKIIIYTLLFASTATMLAVDVYSFSDKYVWSYFICHYLPSLAIGVYVVSISMVMELCGEKFEAINRYLRRYTLDDMKLIQKYYLNKRKETPRPLFDAFPEQPITIYQMIFNIFDDYIDHVRSLNTVFGFDLLVYMIIVTVDVLSFVYDICMDLGQYFKGHKLPPRMLYAIEFWPVMTLFGLVMLLNASSGLMDKANRTKAHLHQLRNLYPKLNKHAESFSLQLLHSTLDINAARFLTIHWGIIYKLISTWITYIIIFIQLETDISTADAPIEDALL